VSPENVRLAGHADVWLAGPAASLCWMPPLVAHSPIGTLAHGGVCVVHLIPQA
jgi:hypothetical protein